MSQPAASHPAPPPRRGCGSASGVGAKNITMTGKRGWGGGEEEGAARGPPPLSASRPPLLWGPELSEGCAPQVPSTMRALTHQSVIFFFKREEESEGKCGKRFFRVVRSVVRFQRRRQSNSPLCFVFRVFPPLSLSLSLSPASALHSLSQKTPCLTGPARLRGHRAVRQQPVDVHQAVLRRRAVCPRRADGQGHGHRFLQSRVGGDGLGGVRPCCRYESLARGSRCGGRQG